MFNTGRIDHLYSDPHVEKLPLTLHYGDLTDGSNLTRIVQDKLSGRDLIDAREVWFRGFHSDVGGGYPDAGLSDIALRWMLDGAVERGLLVDKAEHEAIRGDRLADAHDSLKPVWRLLGWKRRTIPTGSWIHESVQERRERRRDYDPELPPDAEFVR